MNSKNLIAQILGEARHYERFSDIEKLVETGEGLENIPLQPLYHALQNTSTDLIADVLPKLSADQRQAMIDLDFWKKDVISVEGFEYWMEAYSRCKDDQVVADFIRSEDFLLYLKSRVNIWTFDVEEPEYPDHDYYFLTDDTLLLVEYSKDFGHLSELKYLVKLLYTELGMENAYTMLFKLINDNFSVLQEHNYQEKKERLRDYGVMDYYEASQQLHPYLTVGHVAKFIKSKNKTTANLEIKHLNQKLPSSSLVAFEEDSATINSELNKIEDSKRLDYLSFSFIRTVNGTLALKDAFSSSRMTLLQIGKFTRATLELAIDFAKTQKDFGEESVFDYFDFAELYKIGSTLFETNKKQLKKALKDNSFDNEEKEYFLGPWWNTFLDNSFSDLPICRAFGVGLHPKIINNMQVYHYWKEQSDQLCQMLPFIKQFDTTIGDLIKDERIVNEYYLNYEVESIDYEAVLVSSLINHDQEKTTAKLGVTIDEFKVFIKKYFKLVKGEYILETPVSDKLSTLIASFSRKYGLSEILNFDHYLYGILYEHLSGYDYDQLKFDDFQHVGGPVLLRGLIQ